MVHAGMPSVTLTDVARLRLQSISFFLVVLLLSAAVIQRLWNYLGKDIAILPRLSYPRALGVVGLWGLLFILVLTMISGARELMTPGAWEKQGWTYRLATQPQPAPVDLDRERWAALGDLSDALLQYARSHEGRFPMDRRDPELSREKWQVPGQSGMQYVYVGEQSLGDGQALLAFEPDVFGPRRLGLFTDGRVRWVEADEIAQRRAEEKTR
jgi:hypothetical protein